MRLAPVAIRYWNDRKRLREAAILQTQTTHGAAETIEASEIYMEMLADAISGEPLPQVGFS
jgi:ADP-ribosyl-[dinitrogen reductase] hydrolase